MRKVKQIAVTESAETELMHWTITIFALCEDGTIWRRENETEKWIFIEGPPEGKPDYHEPTLEEMAEHLRNKGGNQTFVGRGHHLAPGKPRDEKVNKL